MMDPHSILHYLVGVGKLHVPTFERKRFWQLSKEFGEPWAQEVDSEDIYPIGLYGDSARCATKFGHESILAMFLNLVLWKPRSVRYSRFLLFAIPEERMTSKTLNVFLRRITWSCNHAWYGRFPARDQYGVILAGEAGEVAGKPMSGRFQVTEHRGDWSWAKKIWRFRDAHWNGKYVCHLCDAQSQCQDHGKLFWADPDVDTHQEFSVVGFLAHRCPARDLCTFG